MLEHAINYLNTLPVELMLLIEFFSCICILLLLLKYFELAGLYTFIIAGMFIVNIEVLKIVQFSFYPTPIALGKVLICCIFLAMDIIVECYGKEKARQAIWLGFSSNIMVLILMSLIIGYKPFESSDPQYAIFGIYNESIKNIFLPLPSIAIAGILSYLISQFTDVYLYTALKKKTQGKKLWLRAFVAPALSSFLDNIIFYTLAFYILSPRPLELSVLIFSYILGTYVFRIALIFVSSYVIYIAKWIVEWNAFRSVFNNNQQILFSKNY